MRSSKLKQFGLVMTGMVAGIMISLNFSANADRSAPLPLPVDELRAYADVFNAIKQGYVEPVEDKKLITDSIGGMLSGLDPHSAYLDAEAFKDLQVGTQGEFGGLGIEVGMEDGFVKVISPIEDTPAFRAGVLAGDLIVKLDDTPVKGMSLNDAVKRMRGKPKTQIKLSIIRKGETQPIELTLTREVIKVQSVKSKRIDDQYGYLRITSFQENTAPSVVKHLNDLYKPGQLKGLVLDLRNDPGGLLNAAIGVSAAFLPEKTLVTSTDGRAPDAKHQFYAQPDDYQRGSRDDFIKALPAETRSVPMVVLINGGSASASEIVTGALQDHRRAIVVGTKSFGKGSVQTLIPLKGDGAMRLTTARYYTPSGRSIQALGVMPDIVVNQPLIDPAKEGTEAKAADDQAKQRTEASLRGAITNDSMTDEEKRMYQEELARAEESAKLRDEDYQLAYAVDIIKGLTVIAPDAP